MNSCHIKILRRNNNGTSITYVVKSIYGGS